jgi:type II secretory pathway pseudopilin PulG
VHAQNGFSLVETLATVVVLMSGLATAAAALVQSIRLEAEVAVVARSARLARDLAEELRALPRPDAALPGALDGESPEAACVDLPSACPVELAVRDLVLDWPRRVRAGLGPAAIGDIRVAGDDRPRVAISLRPRASAAAFELQAAP